jgi:hypothetical protein
MEGESQAHFGWNKCYSGYEGKDLKSKVLVDISRLKKKRIRSGNLKYCLRIHNFKGYAKLGHFFL